jgi:hypothetical protein
MLVESGNLILVAILNARRPALFAAQRTEVLASQQAADVWRAWWRRWDAADQAKQ